MTDQQQQPEHPPVDHYVTVRVRKQCDDPPMTREQFNAWALSQFDGCDYGEAFVQDPTADPDADEGRAPTRLDPEVPLVQLCEMMRVTVEDVMRAGGSDPAAEARQIGRQYTLHEWFDVLFNADNSIADCLSLILRAAKVPLWRVHGFAVDGGGRRHDFGEHDARGPTPLVAGERVRDLVWDARLPAASASWEPHVTPHDDTYRLHGGAYVRVF